MKKVFIFCCISVLSAISAIRQEAKTKVLLLGCFHFDNPPLDVAKFENLFLIYSFKTLRIL